MARVPLLIQELAVHVCDKLVFGDHLEDGILIQRLYSIQVQDLW